MSQQLPAAIQELNPSFILQMARTCLNRPDLDLSGYVIEPIQHEIWVETTGGLFRISGTGKSGSELLNWSVVMKMAIQPGCDCLIPGELCYWRREIEFYREGFLGRCSALRAPHCYAIEEKENYSLVCLEDIHDITEAVWSQNDYQKTARRLGKFAGEQLTGKSIPNRPWLCDSMFRTFYEDTGWWARFINPASSNNAWQRSIVEDVYSSKSRDQVLQLWSEKNSWLAAYERLPQVFCHNDAHRPNLLWARDLAGSPDLVVIDWAFCGQGALGSDLGQLVSSAISACGADPVKSQQIEAACLEGYLSGLSDAGWHGDSSLPHLGYLISLVLYTGGTLPCVVAMNQPGSSRVDTQRKFGHPLEEMLTIWSLTSTFVFERAAQARKLFK